jgi:hypothetical protein
MSERVESSSERNSALYATEAFTVVLQQHAASMTSYYKPHSTGYAQETV